MNAINCPSECLVTVQHEIVLPLLNLSAHDGLLISSAIISLWAVAFVIRLFIRFLRDSTSRAVSDD